MERIIVDGLSFSLPLFIMAIVGIYSEKSGIVNLSLEGFQGFGAFTGAFAAVFASRSFGADATTAYVLAILFAVIGACVYSLLYALVCIQFKANQTISGVVLNILATALTAYLTKFLNKRLFEAASDAVLVAHSRADCKQLHSKRFKHSNITSHQSLFNQNI